jgi:hypothetical protein
METTFFYYVAGVLLYFLINFGFANLITNKSKKLHSNSSRYMWACLILSPIFGVLLAILDELTEIRANSDDLLEQLLISKEKQQILNTDTSYKSNLDQNQLYVEKGKKRIIIYENEKDDYINDGWKVVE